MYINIIYKIYDYVIIIFFQILMLSDSDPVTVYLFNPKTEEIEEVTELATQECLNPTISPIVGPNHVSI